MSNLQSDNVEHPISWRRRREIEERRKEDIATFKIGAPLITGTILGYLFGPLTLAMGIVVGGAVGFIWSVFWN